MRTSVVHDQMVRSVISDASTDYAYYTFMTLSGVLAAVALLTDSIPLLLGAMIVAPAYPPLVAVSCSIAGSYPRTAARALLALFAGLVLAIVAAVVTTWLCNVTDILSSASNLVAKPLLEERVRTGWYSILAAVAAGAGGHDCRDPAQAGHTDRGRRRGRARPCGCRRRARRVFRRSRPRARWLRAPRGKYPRDHRGRSARPGRDSTGTR